MTATIDNKQLGTCQKLAAMEQSRFQQTVPRHLVHRTAVSEVFITDMSVITDDAVHVGAQWPRARGFFGPKGRLHDPMLFVETIRQATLVVAHQAYHVPLDAHFVLQEISYKISEEGLRLASRPADIDMLAMAHAVRTRGSGEVVGMRSEYRVYRDLREVGWGEVRWRWASASTYARIRDGRLHAVAPPPPHPVPARLVGRESDADVVLAEPAEAGTWRLRVDTDHPVMFDHPVDHVPGMMAVEAVRQAAVHAMSAAGSAGTAVPLAGRFGFNRYIELDEPCRVVAGPVEQSASAAGQREVRVTLEQDGRTAVSGDLLLRG